MFISLLKFHVENKKTYMSTLPFHCFLFRFFLSEIRMLMFMILYVFYTPYMPNGNK